MQETQPQLEAAHLDSQPFRQLLGSILLTNTASIGQLRGLSELEEVTLNGLTST